MLDALRLPPQTSHRFDVVGYGENSLDVLAAVRTWPIPDSKTPLEDLRIAPGGQVATAVAACARLGCRARFVGVFGGDAWGAEVRGALSSAGVDVIAVVRDVVPTRRAVAIVGPDGRRAILEQRDPRLSLNEGDVDPAVFRSGRILMLDATDVPGSIRAAEAARAAGTRVMVDIERPVEGLDQLLALADVVIASEGYVSGAAKSAAPYVPPVTQLWVTTLGAKGSIARYQGEEIRTPAPTVNVVDTTGAGDAFRGGFAVAWLEAGSGANLHRLLEFANAAGALNCRGLGAQTSLPTRAEIDRLLSCNGGGGRGV